MKTKRVDFYVRNEHSIIMLSPETEAAREWVDNNVCLESWQNRDYIAIEPSYFEDIYNALVREGFILKAA